MNKKRFALGFVLVSIIFFSFSVSAALCKGDDGYYHDCKNYDYYCDDYYTGDLDSFREKCREDFEGYWLYYFGNQEKYLQGYELNYLKYQKDYYSRMDYGFYKQDIIEQRFIMPKDTRRYQRVLYNFYDFHELDKISSERIPRYPSSIMQIF